MMTILVKHFGWFKSQSQLNQIASPNRVVMLCPFEGCKRPKYEYFEGELYKGIYYGQTLNGKRDGYGVMYATDEEESRSDLFRGGWLYECFWHQGAPKGEGRVFRTGSGNSFYRLEGTFDASYYLTGMGKEFKGEDLIYEGNWK